MPRGTVRDNKATSQHWWGLKLSVTPTEENNRKTGEETAKKKALCEPLSPRGI